jgi:hypothetical protein
MNKGSFFAVSPPKVPARWLTGYKSCEVYVAIALPLRTEADRVAAFLFASPNCAGLPLERDRKSRVRKIYSLLHDESAVSLEKYRRSDVNRSEA